MKTTRQTTTTPVATRATAATTNTHCDGISGQHSSYLKDNLDIVRQKCSEFHACTVELYKSENLHRILAGDNIQLRNICGLLYQNANGRYRILDNQCSTQERESIKEILGDELSPNLDGSSSREDSWGKLKTCLDNNNSGSTHLDELCRLKGNSTLPLCNSTDVQTTTEKFFNDKLRQHHCICNTFTDWSAKSLPLVPLVAGVCGGALLLLLIFIIVFLGVRRRKLRCELYRRWGNM
ncbi:uncharacterized protein LOC112558624 isoform X1 [Pomacea canaliculata]|uniref:uncharacterized protein LOC112558624 isoform X1 n=2 Tax=Pomacea canaliculata TaxID=400727 RepID=UPI000D734F43|nr:uncharacterized protein LOC112558624 isoform X1 [Pomacea canaliculata]XP_025084983.1 uncharacterized protein LOC112558624 isoform X1 [Pomacea canaliculata]